MPIAVIGWGSLIWNPGSLRLASRWRQNGPLLPVEFARISDGDRLTLVIHQSSQPVQTLWAAAASSVLDEVREILRDREGTLASRIHSATASGVFSGEAPVHVMDSISQWLTLQGDVSACVWTGLSSNWTEKRANPYSADAAVQYLADLADSSRAKEYIRNAPAQIETAARSAIRTRLGWTNAILPDDLFEKM
jgi:hypothetical protein